MLRTLFISSLVLTISGGLTACSTVTDNIPTVKIERKKKTNPVTVVETQHQIHQASYSAPKVQKAEAAMVCENDNMRRRAADRDLKNDMARVLILEEGGRSSNIIADVEVNCRDYFQSQYQSFNPQIIKASTRVEAADGYYYSIKKGDTLYGIARENCSSVKDISQLNGIADPTKIEIHQIIRLPAKKCNARK